MTPDNALFQLFRSTRWRMTDPGSGKTIYADRQFGVVPVVTAGAEGRTLAQPTKEGIFLGIVLETYVGVLTLTVTGGWNQAADTSLTFPDAGSRALLWSVRVGTSYYWRILAAEAVTQWAAEAIDVHALTALGVAPDVADLVPVSDESAAGDPARSVTVAQLFQAYFDDMTPGTGISTGTGTICEHSVSRVGGLFKTEILVDLTGLNSGGTDGDIIGKNSTANCHIGQITAAKNGAIFAGSMECLEVPVGGTADVDLYSATESTGTEDAAISGLAETSLLAAGGNWTLALVKALTAYPAANEYLYLVGNSGDATYTAGIFRIVLWGK